MSAPETTPIRLAILDTDRMFLDGTLSWMAAFSQRIDPVIAGTRWDTVVGHPDFPVDVMVMNVEAPDQAPMPMKVESAVARGAKVVALGSNLDPVLVRAALAAGADAYVAKTEGLDALATAVRGVVDAGSYLSEDVAEILREVASPLPKLTKQEVRVLSLYAQGMTMKSVAAELHIGYETVKTYVKQMREKAFAAGYDISDKVSMHQFAVENRFLAR